MSDTNKDLEEIAKTTTEDLYELLGVDFDSTESEIKRAYRKTSIKYHPDKNKDDATAADRFINLGFARDILLDAKLKSDYDRSRLRRKEKALQDELLDGRRRKLKEDLERREKEAASAKRKREGYLDERELEMQRLAEDAKRRRIELQEKLMRQRQEEEAYFKEKSPEVVVNRSAPGETADMDRTIKVRFSREGDATSWDKEKISQMFSKYGKIDSIVLGKDKKIRLSGEKHKKVSAMALIVYTRVDHAHAAVLDGKDDYPSLTSVAWAGKEPDIRSPNNPEISAPSTPVATPNKSFRASFHAGLSKGFGTGSAPGTPSFSFTPPKTPSLEEVTMMRLKQAQKKKREEEIRRQEAAEEEQQARQQQATDESAA